MGLKEFDNRYHALVPRGVAISFKAMVDSDAPDRGGAFLEFSLAELLSMLISFSLGGTGRRPGQDTRKGVTTFLAQQAHDRQSRSLGRLLSDLYTLSTATHQFDGFFDAAHEVAPGAAPQAHRLANAMTRASDTFGSYKGWDTRAEAVYEFLDTCLGQPPGDVPTTWQQLCLGVVVQRNCWTHSRVGEQYGNVAAEAAAELMSTDQMHRLFSRLRIGAFERWSPNGMLEFVCKWGRDDFDEMVLISRDGAPDLSPGEGRFLLVDVGDGTFELGGPFRPLVNRVYPVLGSVSGQAKSISGIGHAYAPLGAAVLPSALGEAIVVPVPSDSKVEAIVNGLVSVKRVLEVLVSDNAQLESIVRVAAKQALDTLVDESPLGVGRNVDIQIRVVLAQGMFSPPEAIVAAVARGMANALHVEFPAPTLLEFVTSVCKAEEIAYHWWWDSLRPLSAPERFLAKDLDNVYACPAIDVVMVTPLHRTLGGVRPVIMKSIGLGPQQYGLDDGPPTAHDLARWCDETTKRIEVSQPNPYVTLLRRVQEVFGGLGVISSPTTWACGLLFDPGSGNETMLAERWLKSRNLPPHVFVKRVRTCSEPNPAR